ncbi:SusC/RagA family TonB-linked outer membrane protein [Formosa haliotis]|uniref:SusC/RagA family TonB-linked outer membrane protein n=1 Tax=Formosa haliotis TaxID=1555194 RepID=UPI0008257FAC|nr:SusC/RagA family TonB-linked outer membrane protein [Formosa haliotis]
MEIKLTTTLFLFRKKLLLNIMKTFVFLCCFTAFSLTPGNILSQNAKIVIDVDKTLTVDQVFDLIMSQTDYKFIYEEGIFENLPMVNVKKGVTKANDLLVNSIKGGNFDVRLSSNNTIIIQYKTSSDTPQQILKGKVTDHLGMPLAGVTILVNINERGATTDIDGNYNIKVKIGDKISFNYVGFASQEFVYSNQSILNVELKEEISKLEEVVLVSSGYQKISKERATGAYESITKNQLEKPSSNISERIVGMVAGLQSTPNADGTIDFEIRGRTSLFADQQPLIVLDGFPIEGNFNTINPNDVESITVLKDAAAASIWGAKSANGVIVITTKRAKEGKMSVSISSFTKFSDKLDLDYVVSRASANEVLEYEQKAFDTDFFGGLIASPPGNSSNYLNPYSQAIVAMNEARLEMISAGERDNTLNRLIGLDNKGQIEDNLLQAPITTQYNISISGGSEKMKNNLSLLFEDNKSFFQGDEVKKYLVNYNSNVKLAKKLDFNFAAMMQYNDATNNSGGDMLNTIKSLAPWDMLVNDDGTLADMSYLKYYRPNLDRHVPVDLFPYSDWSYNPISEIENRDLNSEELNVRIQTGLTFEIMKGLSVDSKIQYEMFNTNNRNYFNENTFDVRQFVNETSGPEWNSGGVPTQLVPSGGILEQNSIKTIAYNFRNQLNFNRTFNDIHAVDFVAGSEISDRVIEYTGSPNAFGYNDDTLANNELLGDVYTSYLWNSFPASYAQYFYRFNLSPEYEFSETTSRFFSLYGNLAYTFNDKYSVTGSYRTDASNIISDDPSFRYNPFWSVGLGWQIGKEKFMSNLNWMDRLGLRITYGKNGNIDRSTSFNPLINLSSTLDQVTGQNTATIGSFGNPTLRWEKTETFNLGVDFSIFQGKLTGTVDVYDKKGYDLIVDQSISAVNGTTSQKFNNGEMLNKGVEVQLGTTLPIYKNNIVWSGAINFAHNNNEITNFFKSNYQSYDLYSGPTTSYVEGYDANTLWSYVYGGMINVGSTENPVMQPSVYGENGEKITILSYPSGNAINYMENQGTLVAPTTFGMRNAFKIYNFDFSFIITAKFGHVFRRQSFNYSPVTSGNTMVNSQYSEVANGNPNEILPIPDNQPRYYFYDRFYPYLSYLTEDASHIRFQEVNLTYTLPFDITNKLGLTAINIYGQANNFGVVLFNDFGEDPEFPKGTISPQTSFTFGMQFNF